ncbi:Fur family transcriptional regulator [Treponema brennaborense]|uniref:Ferric uptake regulator, Fur family n=1 Tax=Treponema brennaborense (strain DSM 12168 / CIP 105900 / DD5/3) TaxID=906968 RepID=F4LNS2_TREBD|nr:Fur family transcriptional regulator [Treponema brennaborense]AEE16907.1 ferric uptake regulator, Fur family [Treponema brennaborense DSM 12168]
MQMILNTADIADKLTEWGIRPSVQRIQIYQYVCSNPVHPTAETVYAALAPVIPTLSRTTVYNTLKLFAEHGLVQTLIIEDESVRYDADTSAHLHFKCTECGNVFDIDSDYTPQSYAQFAAELPTGFTAHKIQVCVWGTCPECERKR